MKSFDLNAFGVREMTQQEMLDVDGGSIWGWIKNAAVDTWEWIEYAAEETWDWLTDHFYVRKDGNSGAGVTV
jgi:hypothetical protein